MRIDLNNLLSGVETKLDINYVLDLSNLIYSTYNPIKNGVTKKVTDVLDNADIDYEIYSEIKPNPTIENVQTGVAAFKASGASIPVAAVSPFGIDDIISGSTTATIGISLGSTQTIFLFFSVSVIT